MWHYIFKTVALPSFFTIPSKFPTKLICFQYDRCLKMAILGENYYKYTERWAIHFKFYLLLHASYNASVYDIIAYFQGQRKFSLFNGLHFLLLHWIALYILKTNWTNCIYLKTNILKETFLALRKEMFYILLDSNNNNIRHCSIACVKNIKVWFAFISIKLPPRALSCFP